MSSAAVTGTAAARAAPLTLAVGVTILTTVEVDKGRVPAAVARTVGTLVTVACVAAEDAFTAAVGRAPIEVASLAGMVPVTTASPSVTHRSTKADTSVRKSTPNKLEVAHSCKHPRRSSHSLARWRRRQPCNQSRRLQDLSVRSGRSVWQRDAYEAGRACRNYMRTGRSRFQMTAWSRPERDGIESAPKACWHEGT